MRKSAGRIPVPEKAWQIIKHRSPGLSDEARRELENCLGLCVQIRNARKASKPPTARTKAAKECHDLAVKLAAKLKGLDAATMMDLVDAAPYAPDALALFVQGADVILALADRFKAAAKKKPKRRKSGPDGETFELLVAQWNVIRQNYGAGPISRANCDDVATIAGVFAKAAGDPEIKAGKIDLAIKNVLARPSALTHSDLARTYIYPTGKPITGTDKRKAVEAEPDPEKRPVRIDAHPLYDVLARQMPDRATLVERRTPRKPERE